MEGAVEGQEAQLRGRCEAAEVGVGPVFGGWAAEAGEAAKDAVQAGRLFEEGDALVFEPTGG